MIDSTKKVNKQAQKRLPTTQKQAIPGGSIWTHRMDTTLMVEEEMTAEEAQGIVYSFEGLEKLWGCVVKPSETKSIKVEDVLSPESIESMKVEAIRNMFETVVKNAAKKAISKPVRDADDEFQRSDFDTPIECFA